jgi:Family of unknown function (DUF5681)
MVGRKITAGKGGGKNGYEVGYGKPPNHSQFRPGQSGNPAGRRKGLRNLATDVKTTLATTIKVKEGGRTRTGSTQEGVLMVVRDKALRGDAHSLDLLLGLAERFNTDGVEIGPAQALSADDQAILAAYKAECLAATTTQETPEPSDDPTSKPIESPAKKTPK